MADPPYGVIWDCWKTGGVIPFLGAGASLVKGSSEGQWNPLSGLELAHFLADKANLPSRKPRDRDDLAIVSSYYEDVSGRRKLRGALRDILTKRYQKGPLHDFIAAVPSPQVIVTTNYDTLIEQAFHAAGKPYDLVIYPADRKDHANAVLWWPNGATQPLFTEANVLDIDLAKTTVIYKMHGTIMHENLQWDNFVITEDDYIEFLSRMTANSAVPSLFIKHFRSRSFLFLGYGLRDWNFRVLLRNLGKPLSSRQGAQKEEAKEEDPQEQDPQEQDPQEQDILPSWAIQRRPSELERQLWEKRNVRIYSLGLDEFLAKMLMCRGD